MVSILYRELNYRLHKPRGTRRGRGPKPILLTTFCIEIFRESLVISISRSGLLKSCARFIIEQSEIRKKEHDFKNVHFECRMGLFYTIWVCRKKLIINHFSETSETDCIEYFLNPS